MLGTPGGAKAADWKKAAPAPHCNHPAPTTVYSVVGARLATRRSACALVQPGRLQRAARAASGFHKKRYQGRHRSGFCTISLAVG
jgi:hypothetical protein